MKISLSGLRVTVMGLGVHGGGLAAARYAVSRGAEVTVTDLRDQEALKKSLQDLPGQCRVVLGRHEETDFTSADLIIKNPAVPRTAPLLQHYRPVTNDIALFLAEWKGLNGVSPEGSGKPPEAGAAPPSLASPSASSLPPLVAITGTKGKSTCTSLTAHLLKGHHPGTRLGGNITISPLAFLDEMHRGDPVVLELSSFQLGDLAFFRSHNGRPGVLLPSQVPRDVLFPTLPATAAVITNIFRDHQDYYTSMESYVADKREIYSHLPSLSMVVLSGDNEWTPSFLEDLHRMKHPGQTRLVATGDPMNLPEPLPVPGRHNRLNIEMAVHAALHSGVPKETIFRQLGSFPGVPHRLQTVARRGELRFVNDTAATIPEAALEAVLAFTDAPSGRTVFLIAGGSDKGLDPAPLLEAFDAVIRSGGAVALLDGSGTARIREALAQSAPGTAPRETRSRHIRTFTSLAEAVTWLVNRAEETLSSDSPDSPAGERVILLSPGCASFGMFRNEFDRGDQFVRLTAGSDTE
jgi:UDP-N-acetylmuramoylalanine--D-glutamate ligase